MDFVAAELGIAVTVGRRGQMHEDGLRYGIDAHTAGDRLADISYDGMGCAISQASASVLYELLHGAAFAEAAE